MSDSTLNKETKEQQQQETQVSEDNNENKNNNNNDNDNNKNVESTKPSKQMIKETVYNIMKKNASKNNKTKSSKNDSKKIALTQEEFTNFKIIEEIENLLEPSNVMQDHNLRSRMNDHGYVKIDFLKSLPSVNTITTDTNVIINALRRSKKLKCKDNLYVKYESWQERNVLILRDFPTNIPLEEVEKIFNDPECGVVKEIRPEVGNNWFISFETEEDCLKTVKYLQKCNTFQNKQLHVRVKSSSTNAHNLNNLLYDDVQMRHPTATQQSDNAFFSNADQLVYDQMYSTPPFGPEFSYPPYVYYPYSPIQQSVNTNMPPTMQLPPQHSVFGQPSSTMKQHNYHQQPQQPRQQRQQRYQHQFPPQQQQLYPQQMPTNKNNIQSTNAGQDTKQSKQKIGTTTTETKHTSQSGAAVDVGTQNPTSNMQGSPLINTAGERLSPKQTATSSRAESELTQPQVIANVPPKTEETRPRTTTTSTVNVADVSSSGQSPLITSNAHQKNITRQWTSDYPNDNFLKYTRQDFFEAFKKIASGTDLTIPNSMKGRDIRIISEDFIEPLLIHEDEENQQRKIREQLHDDNEDRKKTDDVYNENENQNEEINENDNEFKNDNDDEELVQEQYAYHEDLEAQDPNYYDEYNHSYVSKTNQKNVNHVYRSRRNKQQQSGRQRQTSYYSKKNVNYNNQYDYGHTKRQPVYRPKQQNNVIANNSNKKNSTNQYYHNRGQNSKLVYKPKSSNKTEIEIHNSHGD